MFSGIECDVCRTARSTTRRVLARLDWVIASITAAGAGPRPPHPPEHHGHRETATSCTGPPIRPTAWQARGDGPRLGRVHQGRGPGGHGVRGKCLVAAAGPSTASTVTDYSFSSCSDQKPSSTPAYNVRSKKSSINWFISARQVTPWISPVEHIFELLGGQLEGVNELKEIWKRTLSSSSISRRRFPSVYRPSK